MAHPDGISGIHLYSFNRLDMPIWERSDLPDPEASEAASA
jgi:hypothetical protein